MGNKRVGIAYRKAMPNRNIGNDKETMMRGRSQNIPTRAGRNARRRRWKSVVFSLLTAVWLSPITAQQSREPLPIMTFEAPTPQSSYEARVLKRKDVHDVDPNIYAYTAEFARRFQMPEQWIAHDLKGAEAIAFRVMPNYKTCGWGGNPEACKDDEVRCMLDAYFDHDKQPLPWDERMPSVRVDGTDLSVHFLRSSVHPQMLRMRPKDGFMTRFEPFVDPASGKGLAWNGGYWHGKSEYGSSFVGLRAYDRQAFRSVSVIVLGIAACDGKSVPQSLWLSHDNIGYQEREKANLVIDLPADWQARVRESLASYDQRRRAFFRKEGEKALKSMQGKPASKVPVVPLQ